MAYRTNPFLERMSERTTSDQEFVRLFSPKILEHLSEDVFEGAVHIFRSPPGGGKTTLLRAFTPTALRAFWNARRVQEMSESYQGLVARNILDQERGPQLLGVLLSCASGYADLPPGATIDQEGLFRALLDCRIVLRALRSLAVLTGQSSPHELENIRLEYDEIGMDLKHIPITSSAQDLIQWAEKRERSVYAELDSVAKRNDLAMPPHVRFEGVLWLQSVHFIVNGDVIAPKRLLMIDDLHKLRRRQRAVLIEELTEIRPSIPIWLAERTVALGEQLISQGSREGRDVREYFLEEIWSGIRGQFLTFAQNILDRRLEIQSLIPPGSFAQYLASQLPSDDVRKEVAQGCEMLRAQLARYQSTPRYAEWLAQAQLNLERQSLESLHDLFVLRILLARDELKRQLTLDLMPLPAEELDQRDSSSVQAAAEIFIHDEVKVPYYFGIERLCTMATGNVEELLSLAAPLYDGLQAKQILRKPDLLLSAKEQEKIFKDVAKRKRDFIPKNHTEGLRAQRLLDAVGSFCRDRTFVQNAPIAPGVTGIRLSQAERAKLDAGRRLEGGVVLKRVLAECVGENLLVTRPSSSTGSREAGTVFYLNRTLCLHYGLPLQMGGWQDVSADDLIDWMERGRTPSKHNLLEIH